MIAGHLVPANRAELLDDDVLGVGKVGRAGYRARHDADLAQSGMTEGTAGRNRAGSDVAASRGGDARSAATAAAAASSTPADPDVRRAWTSVTGGSSRPAAVAAVTGVTSTSAVTFQTGGCAAAGAVAASGSCWREQTCVHLLVGANLERRGRAVPATVSTPASTPAATAAAATTTAPRRGEVTRVHLFVITRRAVALEVTLTVIARIQAELISGHVLVAAHGAPIVLGDLVEIRLEAGHAAALRLRRSLAMCHLLLLRLGLLLLLVAHGRRRALRAIAVGRRAVMRLRLLLRRLLPASLRTALRTQVERRHVQGYQARVLHLQ